MSEEVKIEGAGKVPRKEKVLYFLRFHAWSLIALGVAWFIYFAREGKFDLFLLSVAAFILLLCVTWGALALRVAKVDEESWEEGTVFYWCVSFLERDWTNSEQT